MKQYIYLDVMDDMFPAVYENFGQGLVLCQVVAGVCCASSILEADEIMLKLLPKKLERYSVVINKEGEFVT